MVETANAISSKLWKFKMYFSIKTKLEFCKRLFLTPSLCCKIYWSFQCSTIHSSSSQWVGTSRGFHEGWKLKHSVSEMWSKCISAKQCQMSSHLCVFLEETRRRTVSVTPSQLLVSRKPYYSVGISYDVSYLIMHKRFHTWETCTWKTWTSKRSITCSE